MNKHVTVCTAILLAACAPPPKPVATFGTETTVVADAGGWYRFGPTRFKGAVINGVPDGAGLCIDTRINASATVSCSYSRGVRTDEAYIAARNRDIEQRRLDEIEERKERARERAELEAIESQRRAEERRAEREYRAANPMGNIFAQQTQSTLNMIGAQSKALEDARRSANEKEAQRRAQQASEQAQAREDREVQARRQSQETVRRQQLVQASSNQQEQARRAAELQRREREAQEAAQRHERERATVIAQQDMQKKREHEMAEEKRRQKEVKPPEMETCVLQGTGICRGGAITETKGGMFYVKQPNNCGYRLYVEICIKTKSGRDDCGSDAIKPGGTTSYWRSSDDVTGQFTVTAVGVLKGGDDWSCMAKKARLGGGE